MPDLPPKADRDQALRTPPVGGTEAYGSSGHTTADLKALDLDLRSLQQRYDLLEELGQGGMGIVYRARDRETEEYVALKILRPEVAARADIIERFKAELRLARKITHKNVCRTYELLRFDDTTVIAMEYVEGQSLRKVLEGVGGVSLRRGLEWASQICDALHEAHAQGVVHRDLKPENIVIGRRGEVKVMDFGIARSIDKDATHTGTVIGTPAYMAPEQAEGRPIDQRADIYSLGLILYEMFTGRHAFQGDSGFALAYKQIHETPPRPHEVEPTLPENIAGAIVRATEKDPEKRFASVKELKSALSSRPEGAAPPPTGHVPGVSREVQVVLGFMVLGLVLTASDLVPQKMFVDSLLFIASLLVASLTWPILRDLRSLFWAGTAVAVVNWALAALIYWKLEYLLLMRFKAAGLALPFFTEQLVFFIPAVLRIYPIAVIFFGLLLLLRKPISARQRRSFFGRWLYRDDEHFESETMLRIAGGKPFGIILLAANSMLAVVVVYAVLVLPFLELAERSNR